MAPRLQGVAINKKLTKKWSLFGTGVTTDNFTPKGALIMVGSVLLYAIIQVQSLTGRRSSNGLGWQCTKQLIAELSVSWAARGMPRNASCCLKDQHLYSFSLLRVLHASTFF